MWKNQRERKKAVLTSAAMNWRLLYLYAIKAKKPHQMTNKFPKRFFFSVSINEKLQFCFHSEESIKHILMHVASNRQCSRSVDKMQLHDNYELSSSFAAQQWWEIETFVQNNPIVCQKKIWAIASSWHFHPFHQMANLSAIPINLYAFSFLSYIFFFLFLISQN